MKFFETFTQRSDLHCPLDCWHCNEQIIKRSTYIRAQSTLRTYHPECFEKLSDRKEYVEKIRLKKQKVV
jgi:hypothetical protein